MSFSDAAAFLALPLAASLILVAIHAWFGLQVLARGVIFVDLALAQVAALGATVAFALGHPPQSAASMAWSLGFTLAGALVLAFTRSWSGRIPQEALIGILYVVAAAAGFLLIEQAPQGAEHVKQLLTGNIVTVGAAELKSIMPLYAAVGALAWGLRSKLAHRAGAHWAWELLFYAAFGVVVTSSVAIAGVLLVFSFLIIPAAIGVLWAERPAMQLALGWLAGALASIAGLGISFRFNLPTGATMVCAFGAVLVLAGIASPLRTGPLRGLGRAARMARALLAAALALSGLWLIAAPRADQPLLDGAEYLFPSLRWSYMTGAEREIHEDAKLQAERYRHETDRLNERERRSRWEDRNMDETELRRLSSFLKSYNEMRKGEEFVMREVRARARVRERWPLGGAMLLAALLIVPGLFSRLRPAALRAALRARGYRNPPGGAS